MMILIYSVDYFIYFSRILPTLILDNSSIEVDYFTRNHYDNIFYHNDSLLLVSLIFEINDGLCTK